MIGKVMAILILLVTFFMLLPEPGNQQNNLDLQLTKEQQKIYDSNFIIRNVRMYDGKQRYENVDVSIINNRIAAIAVVLPVQDQFLELDGSGKTLLPGLIDAHTHAFQNALSEALNFGVTTELDMFTMPSYAAPHQQKRDQLTNHQAADLFSATILATAPGGHGTEYGFDIPVLKSVEQVPAFVEQRIQQGADYIKAVYNSEQATRHHFPSISASILKALINSAHAKQRLLVVHVDNLISAHEAISFGADGIIHSFMDKPVDLAFVDLMRSTQSFIIPTLSVEASFSQNSEGPRLLNSEVSHNFLSQQQQQQLKAVFPDFGIPSTALQIAFDSVKRLSDAGVAILAGSDAPNPGTTHGLSLHGELELLTRIGLSNEQALHAATGAVSQQFPVGSRGTLVEGAAASMLMVDGNPFETITDTQRIIRIWKNGQEFERQNYSNRIDKNLVLASGLITDFEVNINHTLIGNGLSQTSDKFAGGNSTVALQLIEVGKEESSQNNQYLQVKGQLKSGFMFPWSGVNYQLGENRQTGIDLTGLKSITFRAKGATQTNQLSVLLFQPGSFRPIQRNVKLTSDWQLYRVELAELKGLQLSDVNNISFVQTNSPTGAKDKNKGEFEFMLDDLRFE